jgi:hypothetical protein
MPTAPRAMVTVSGTILDREGHGIQAVYVDFVDLAPRAKGTYAAYYHLVTNVAGTFSGSIPEGRYDVFITPPAFSAYAPVLLLSQAVGRAGLRLDHRFDYVRLAIRPSIAGGQPVSALEGRVWPDAYLGFVWDQKFRLDGDEREVFVPAGTYNIQLDLTGPGFGYPQKFMGNVTLSADTTIDVAFSGNAVGMHVTGPDGQPLANARVRASGRGVFVSTTTDAAGSATLYLPAGTYALVALAATQEVMGRTLENVPIAGDASFDFDLSGTTWTGVVRRASDGSPVDGAFVLAAPEGPPNVNAVSKTDANGAFHLVVQSGLYHRIRVYELVGGDAYGLVATIDSVAAGADSTFDIPAGDPPQPPVIGTTRVLPAGPGAPASAAADPAFRRRSFRTGG